MMPQEAQVVSGVRPEDREQIIQDLRLDHQTRARNHDPEAFDAYWHERAKKVNGNTRIPRPEVS